MGYRRVIQTAELHLFGADDRQRRIKPKPRQKCEKPNVFDVQHRLILYKIFSIDQAARIITDIPE